MGLPPLIQKFSEQEIYINLNKYLDTPVIIIAEPSEFHTYNLE